MKYTYWQLSYDLSDNLPVDVMIGYTKKVQKDSSLKTIFSPPKRFVQFYIAGLLT